MKSIWHFLSHQSICTSNVRHTRIYYSVYPASTPLFLNATNVADILCIYSCSLCIPSNSGLLSVDLISSKTFVFFLKQPRFLENIRSDKPSTHPLIGGTQCISLMVAFIGKSSYCPWKTQDSTYCRTSCHQMLSNRCSNTCRISLVLSRNTMGL